MSQQQCQLEGESIAQQYFANLLGQNRVEPECLRMSSLMQQRHFHLLARPSLLLRAIDLVMIEKEEDGAFLVLRGGTIIAN